MEKPIKNKEEMAVVMSMMALSLTSDYVYRAMRETDDDDAVDEKEIYNMMHSSLVNLCEMYYEAKMSGLIPSSSEYETKDVSEMRKQLRKSYENSVYFFPDSHLFQD